MLSVGVYIITVTDLGVFAPIGLLHSYGFRSDLTFTEIVIVIVTITPMSHFHPMSLSAPLELRYQQDN